MVNSAPEIVSWDGFLQFSNTVRKRDSAAQKSLIWLRVFMLRAMGEGGCSQAAMAIEHG
jgi:hypothetical protein